MTRLVDEYISTAHPVGSLFLVERYRLTWSSATIRNDMALLEEAGYMFQPYTSAGRVPTEQGYRLYIEHMRPKQLTQKNIATLEQTIDSLKDGSPRSLKKLSSILSDISGEVAFVSTTEHTVFSGLQNLCQKPEFHDVEFMEDITRILDTIDEVLEGIRRERREEPTMYIGDEESFGKMCSVLLVSCLVNKEKVIVGILGPLRMNYQKNIALLQSLNTKPATS